MFLLKKKLTLREIHALYLVLEHALPEKEEDYLIDQIDSLLSRAKEGTIVRSLEIMKIKTEKKSDIQLLILFIRGLKENNFFEYVEFIKGLKGLKKIG